MMANPRSGAKIQQMIDSLTHGKDPSFILPKPSDQHFMKQTLPNKPSEEDTKSRQGKPPVPVRPANKTSSQNQNEAKPNTGRPPPPVVTKPKPGQPPSPIDSSNAPSSPPAKTKDGTAEEKSKLRLPPPPPDDSSYEQSLSLDASSPKGTTKTFISDTTEAKPSSGRPPPPVVTKPKPGQPSPIDSSKAPSSPPGKTKDGTAGTKPKLRLPPPPLDESSSEQSLSPDDSSPTGTTQNVISDTTEPDPKANYPLPPIPKSDPSYKSAVKEKEKKSKQRPLPPPPDDSSSEQSTDACSPKGTTKKVTSDSTEDDCIITVTGFVENVTEEGLKLHFENHKKSGGGPVDSVTIIDGAALVHFRDSSDARRVLKRQQFHRGKFLKLDSLAESIIKNMFMVSGMSVATTHELLKDFLESKTKHSVENIEDVEKDLMLVTFPEESAPEYDDIKNVLSSETLDGCHLKVSRYHLPNDDYEEPMDKHVISISSEKFRFIQNYQLAEIEKQIESYPMALIMDPKEFQITINGKIRDLSAAKKYLTNILSKLEVTEHEIVMPGIYSLLQTESAKEKMAVLEKKEQCTMFVQEEIYERVEFQFDESDSTTGDDTDSNPSGGSFKSFVGSEMTERGSNQPEENYGVVMKSDACGKFKIGKCQFLIKEGDVASEVTECIVNITQSEIDQGDIWTYLENGLKDDLIRQFTLRGSEWKRKGIVVSSVTILPCKYIIHVSLKQFGDLVKAVNKCLQVVNTMKGVVSVSFFAMDDNAKKEIRVEDAPRVFVEAINKFRRANRLAVVDVSLVVDKMKESYLSGVEKEIEAMESRKKNRFWKTVPKIFKKSPSHSPSSVTQASQMTESESGGPEEAEYNDGEQEDHTLDNADAVVFICSRSKTTNETAFTKLKEFCRQELPPKVINDPRIRNLTKQQLKQLRKSCVGRVEMDVDIYGCCVDIKGFSKDVARVDLRLKKLLDKIPDPTINERKDPFPEVSQEDKGPGKKDDATLNSGTPDDGDDIFWKFVAKELQEIPDENEKRRIKHNIKKLLMEAQLKYMA